MSSAGPIAAPRPVLAEALAPALARSMPLAGSIVAVLGAALLTAASAQVVIPLGFSPVPITGTTFAVLLTAAALGPLRGVAAQILYLTLGLVGLPFFQDGQSGVAVYVRSDEPGEKTAWASQGTGTCVTHDTQAPPGVQITLKACTGERPTNRIVECGEPVTDTA
jgi:hypothetical protein